MKKIMIIAGGTGGHIFPALTVADHCYAQGVSIHWLGAKGGMEEDLVDDRYHLETVKISGLRGKSKWVKLFAPLQICRAVWQSLRILNRVKPDVVIGMGGFVSGPGGLSAWLLRIPLVIHEQNSILGLTNRILSRLAKANLQAFPNAFPARANAKTVGNPVRQDIAALPEPASRYQFHRGPVRVLIIGGSRGAKNINRLMMDVFAQWGDHEKPLVWHQTGSADVETVKAAYEQYAPLSVVDPFIKDMAAAYAWADIVVARAGALTVSELSSVGLASILVPFPYAVDDHQYLNGKWLADQGGALIFKESELSVEKMRANLLELIVQGEKRLAMAEIAHRFGQPASGAKVIAACENAYRQSKGVTSVTID